MLWKRHPEKSKAGSNRFAKPGDSRAARPPSSLGTFITYGGSRPGIGSQYSTRIDGADRRLLIPRPWRGPGSHGCSLRSWSSPGKAPIAYSEPVRLGRIVHARWRFTVALVSASFTHGGLSPLNELIHEDGHAVHCPALRTRPAFMDIDTHLAEAFADVAGWNTYDPAWQRKYVGREAPPQLRCGASTRVSFWMSHGPCSRSACSVIRRRTPTRYGPKSQAVTGAFGLAVGDACDICPTR